MTGKRKITDDIRISMLTDRASGASLKDIASKHGVVASTICRELADLEGKIASMAPGVTKYISLLDTILGDRLRTVLDQITPEKAVEANLAQLATAANLLNAMRRLESGQSTSAQEVKYTKVDLSQHANPSKIIETEAKQVVSSLDAETMRTTMHTISNEENETPSDSE